MRILVTGANGFLGRGVVRALLDKGADVFAVGRNTDLVDSRAARINEDIFNEQHPYEKFGYPDVLLHLAWRDGFVHYSDAHVSDLPLHYEFLKKFMNTPIKQIAVVGSMHEIGFFEGSIKEETPCNPITPYGIAKNTLRQLANMLCLQNGKKFQWLRGYYIVANDRYGSSIFSKIALAEHEGKNEFPFTMGQNQFDFIDYDDFCDQVSACVLQDQILGIINICSGYPEKLADRVERFIKENGFAIKLKYGAFPDRPYDSKAVWGDGEKIQTILKVSEKERLKEGE